MLDRQDIITQIRERLTAKRFDHSIGVMTEASKLAQHYGADIKKAEITGLVHDCCKDVAYIDIIELAKIFSVHLDDVTLKTPKLIHAHVGAAYAREIFGIDDPEILDAVAYHTTGRAGMTLLEKIIYIADYIEPTREGYPWLQRMRYIAYNDIDVAIQYGLDIAIDYLVKDNLLIHKDTIEARNDIISKRGTKD